MPMAELSGLGKEQMEKTAEAEHALVRLVTEAHCSDLVHINRMVGYGVYVVNLIPLI